MKSNNTILMFAALATSSILIGSAQTIPEGTKIRVRLDQTISSARAVTGQPIQFRVADDVMINDAVLISEGTSVSGRILNAEEKRRMGRAGKLDFSIERVRLSDFHALELRYTPEKITGKSHTLRTGLLTTGFALVFWPAAPFMLLPRGDDVVLNKGVTFDMFTDTPYTLKTTSAPRVVSVRTLEHPVGTGQEETRYLLIP